MVEMIASAQKAQRWASGHYRQPANAQMRSVERSTFPLLIVLIAAIFLRCVAGAQVSQPSQKSSGEEYTLKLNSNLVTLSATVLDRHNALVSGLVKDDFQIYENKVLQPIKHFSHEDIPVTVGIVVDNSGSMKSKRDDVITAALAFASSSNPQDQMFVVNFNDSVSLGLPAKIPFTDKRDQLQAALSGIRTIGQTALYDGIAVGLDHLKLGNRDKKVLVVISDGGDNRSKHNLAQVLNMAKQSSAIIYAIGIYDESDGDQNPGVLNKFARETGGKAYFPASSREIPSICEEIARDIRNQYMLAYVPTIAAQDSSYRTIEVKASAPGHGRLSVRTRPGYFVSSTSSPLAAR
jgi:VWFA-related protein